MYSLQHGAYTASLPTLLTLLSSNSKGTTFSFPFLSFSNPDGKLKHVFPGIQGFLTCFMNLLLHFYHTVACRSPLLNMLEIVDLSSQVMTFPLSLHLLPPGRLHDLQLFRPDDFLLHSKWKSAF